MAVVATALVAAMAVGAAPVAAVDDPPDTTGGPSSEMDPSDPFDYMTARPSMVNWAWAKETAQAAGVDLEAAPLAGNEGSGSRSGVTLTVLEPRQSRTNPAKWTFSATLSKKGATGPVTFRLVRKVAEREYAVPKEATVRSVKVDGERQARVTLTFAYPIRTPKNLTLVATYEPDGRALGRDLLGMTVTRFVSIG